MSSYRKCLTFRLLLKFNGFFFQNHNSIISTKNTKRVVSNSKKRENYRYFLIESTPNKGIREVKFFINKILVFRNFFLLCFSMTTRHADK